MVARYWFLVLKKIYTENKENMSDVNKDLLKKIGDRRFSTILADPPWQFNNRTGKMAPEHKRLNRYSTMSLQEISELPVETVAEERAHLYLWVPNALLPEGLDWGNEPNEIL